MSPISGTLVYPRLASRFGKGRVRRVRIVLARQAGDGSRGHRLRRPDVPELREHALEGRAWCFDGAQHFLLQRGVDEIGETRSARLHQDQRPRHLGAANLFGGAEVGVKLVLSREGAIFPVEPFEHGVEQGPGNASRDGLVRIGVEQHVLGGRDEIRKVDASRGMPKPGMGHFMGNDRANCTLIQDDQQWQADDHRDLPSEQPGISADLAD